MLSFLYPRWCKPGLGPVGQMKLLEVLPAAEFASLGMGEVSQFVKQLAHLGLPGKLRRRYGQLFFRFLVLCQGPRGQIRLFFAVPDIRLMGFQTAFQTHYSGIDLLPTSENANPFSKIHEHTITAEGRSTNRGLYFVAPFHFTDKAPLCSMMMAMGACELKSEEEVWLDIAFAPVTQREVQKRIQKAEKWLQSPANEPFSVQTIRREMTTDAKSRPKQRDLSEQQSNLFRALQGRRSGETPGFWTSFRVMIHSFSSKARLQTMNSTLHSMKDLNGIVLRPVRPEKMKARCEWGAPTQGLLFTNEELANWLRLPDVGSTAALFVKTMAAKRND